VTCRPDPSDYGDLPSITRRVYRLLVAIMFLIALAVLSLACVRRGQICITAEHGQVDPNWSRSNNVGASVCADVEPPGEPE
jgi:hypothetical protein